MNKTAIKNFAIWARRKLISDITYKAGMLGITETGIAQPMKQSTKDLQFFDIGTKDYVEISGAEIQQRNALLSAIRAKEKTTDYKTAFRNVVEEVAYTWFNRLIAVRFMEVNDYLPSHIRVLSSDNPNKLEPDFVTTPFETDLEFSPYEKDVVLQLKDQNKLDELFRMLFIKQCNKLSQILSELFEQISDYTELLLTISFTDKDGVIYHLTHDISEDDFNIEKEGQIEIIGWLYQYYNTEPKDEVFALLKKNVKITKERIPAATQLFTPDWIVRYMVENSLGRLCVEGHPNGDLKATWKYYLEEAEQEPEVQVQLAKIREEYAKINPEEIKLIDPCMGSGHILVYAFDVLMQIYTSYGYTQRDAAKSILQNNIYGIDIDTRAYQLAYFAVMMKARQYNRRIFNEGILPNLMAVKNPAPCSDSCLKRLGDLEKLGRRLIADFKDAEEYGSILQLNYTKAELDALDSKLDDIDKMADYGNLLVQMESIECVNTLAPLVRQARIMSQKYDVVVTNPPYMGSKSMSSSLANYVQENYSTAKFDLFAAFILRGLQMTRKNGFSCLVTMQSWMFLSSFERMRAELLTSYSLTNLMHMGNMVMGIAFGTSVSSFRNVHLFDYKASFIYVGNKDIQNDYPVVFPPKNRRNGYKKGDAFINIPGSPIAYWASDRAIKNFVVYPFLGELFELKQGLITADNERFLRQWSEVSNKRFIPGEKTISDFVAKDGKWLPYNKGGEYRKWYGNNDLIVNWENEGFDIRNYKNDKGKVLSRPQNIQYFGREGASWSIITNGNFSLRYTPTGFGFDARGSMMFARNTSIYYGLAVMCSNVARYYLGFLSPTVSFEVGNVSKVPFINDDNKADVIVEIAKENVRLSKEDWDAFEESWDFTMHPLLKWRNASREERTVACNSGMAVQGPLQSAYTRWILDCEERFNTLKANEEEINRIFIELYGVKDELTPTVEDKDITIRKADLQRDIKSLISYAVGCMFGRYSLDVLGLAYAGGEWDDSKYHTFLPDPDNCIPITDEEYFQDDIVGRFVDFIRIVYGAATLEENLEFIANALGNGGKTARDTIRQYFLKDFFKDHCQTYSVTGSGKRPIYWLFDSGKQNGFKALVYMHRWNADTVGNLRVEYLHKMQTVYEKEIENCQDAIDNSLNNREIAAATKRKEKLVKQLKECKDYDAKVAHIALSRIDIDLDDGVKFNYRKVQTGADDRFCEILADSKDIMIKEDSPIWQARKKA